MTVKIVVDLKKLLDLISPEEYFGLFGMSGASVTTAEVYSIMLNFIADENGVPFSPDEARAYIKEHVKMSEFGALVADFRRAVVEALANPTKGGR